MIKRGEKNVNRRESVAVIKGYCSPRGVCVREAKWMDKLERRSSERQTVPQ